MSVLIEFFSVVVPWEVKKRKYKGGLEQYNEDCPNMSYKSDGELTRVAFMDDVSLHHYCENLIKKGLQYNDVNNSSKDFVVVQLLQGNQWPADWLEIDDVGRATYKYS